MPQDLSWPRATRLPLFSGGLRVIGQGLNQRHKRQHVLDLAMLPQVGEDGAGG